MQKLNDYIEEKKIKSNKAPRYGMKKLAVGLVSCILGYTVLVSPGVVHAEEVKEPEAVVMEAEEEKEEALPEEIEEGEVSEEEEKEAVTAAETKEEVTEEEKEETAEEEKEETEKKLVTLDEYNALQEEENEEELKEGAAIVADVLGFSKGNVPEAVGQGETVKLTDKDRGSKDISNELINPSVSIRTESTETDGTLNAALGEQLRWDVSFTTPEGTKEGDTFTVKLSDNMSLKGLEPDTNYALPVKFGDKTIATAERIDRQTIKYTFTKDIEEFKYARVYIINSAQENKDVVQNSGNQTFKINVGEKAKAEKDINVDFGKLYHAETSENVNGRSQFTEFNPETGEFTQVFYLNPESKVINTSSTEDQNGREFGKVGFLLSSPHDADKTRSIDYKSDNTKIDVYKLPKGAKLPDAIIENPEGAQPATNAHGGFRNFKGESMFTMDFGNGKKIDSPYVVVVKGHANKIDGKYNELYSLGTLYGEGTASLFLDNSYTVQENSTNSEGEKETLGYFKEHHIYITKKDGKETSRFEIPGATVSGTADEYYYTDKNDIPGYHFVKIGEGDNAPKYNPAYNDKGEITKGNFEVGKTKEVTYIYEKDIKHGSFKETHVYKTLDFEGNVVEDKTITESKDATSGTKDESYTSAKVDKNGYEFTKVTADQGSDEVTISEDGKQVKSGNYVEDKNLSVTYEYVKQPGRFVEHHIYKTVDKDGNEVSTDKTVNVPEEGKPAVEGYSNEAVSTKQRAEEGYTFKEATEIKLQNDESVETYTNYVPGKILEKTYIYTKTQEEQTKEDPKEGPKEDPKEQPKKPEQPEEQPDPKKPITPIIHEEEKPDPTPDPTPTPEETPVEEPKEDPAPKREEEKPEPKEEPKTEEPKEEETPEETPVEEPKEEEKEVVVEEEHDEADRSKDTTHKHEGKEDYSKAPQTGVAGAAGYLGLAGLSTALLAAL